jgi:DNA-binding CsgD family transcriptional regulator
VIETINKTEEPAELWRTVRRYFRDHGLMGLAYFVTTSGRSSMVKGFNIIHRGFPRPISQAYLDEGLGSFDPGPGFALARGVPMRWSRMWEQIEPDEKETFFLDRMREIGLGDGYNFPVYGPASRNGTIAAGRPVREDILDFVPVDEMHIVAQTAHMRLCRLLPDRPPLQKPLSARELEILDWVARGKSNSVIADILDLSGATVDTYLRRIYDKLDVSDRTSAAVRGVGMGLIAA